ncbi:MAG: hypothetical protein WBE86_09060 [Candidatus Acidiferrales bacterium]
MLRELAVACALACLALPACAQSSQSGIVRGMTMEAGGGYAFTDFNAPGWPNVNGFYGSLGINVTRWLQVYGDGSGQFGTVVDGNTRI